MKNSNFEYRNEEVFTLSIDGEIYDTKVVVDFFDKEGKNKTSKVYVHPTNETIAENLIMRRSRNVELYKKIATACLPKFSIYFESMRWSQKAGCSCGCSPGFVFSSNYDRRYYNVYVSYKKVEETV